MFGLRLIALGAALAAHPLAAQPQGGDSDVLAAALSGQELALTMRGTTVAVLAEAQSAENGCAARVTAHAAGSDRAWSRLFRWGDIAWAGATGDGRTMVAFHDHDARLATDSLTFRPVDLAGFRATLERVAGACRAARGEGERFLASGQQGGSSCYFPRVPGLQLVTEQVSATPAPPARALLSILARENPEAELQLLLERAAPGREAGGDDWGRPAIAFTFADPRLKDMRIADASFALDAKPVTAQHSLAAYGDTRVRISMDPFRTAGGAADPTGFYRRLAGSDEVTLTLLDGAKQAKAVLHFDAGSAIADARKALKAADWSCAGAAPAPPLASHWEKAH